MFGYRTRAAGPIRAGPALLLFRHRVQAPILVPQYDTECFPWEMVRVRHDHVFQVILDCEPSHVLPTLLVHGGIVRLGYQDVTAPRDGSPPVVKEPWQLVPPPQSKPARELLLLHWTRNAWIRKIKSVRKSLSNPASLRRQVGASFPLVGKEVFA